MNLDIRICLEFSALSLGFNLEIASALTCLAMTPSVIASRRRGNPSKVKTQKSKCKMTKQSVISNQRSAND